MKPLRPALISACVLSLLVLAGAFGARVVAQTAPASVTERLNAPAGGIYTLNQDRLFSGSMFGRRVMKELAERQQALARENKKLEEQLKAEEKDLTVRRDSLDPKTFRKLADDFDKRVEKIRKDQARKVNALNSWVDGERKRFFKEASRLVPQFALEHGISVILDERTVVFAVRAADITPALIKRLDASLGNGTGGNKP